MAMPSFRRSAQALVLLGAGWLGPLACSSDPTTTTGVTHPTMIEVSPGDFLGDLPCGEQPGAVRRYVATLFDVTEQLGGAGGEGNTSASETDGQGGSPAAAPILVASGKCGGFQLPSSLPVSCLAGVGFGYVVSGRHYCAEIDAYDSDLLEPRGSGSRQMVVGDAADGAPPASDAAKVEPAWHAICRQATAATATIVPARDCEVLSPQPDADALGELRVDTAKLLGDLSCGSEPGQVERLVVELELDDYMGDTQLEVPCGDAAVYAAVPPGRLLSLYVSAFEADLTQAFAGAECHARAKPGTSVNATCPALSQVGTLRVDLPAALEALGLECDATSVTDVRVSVADEERSLPPPDCLQPFDHGFAAGEGSITVTATPASGEPQALICANVVEPGRVVVADCSPSRKTSRKTCRTAPPALELRCSMPPMSQGPTLSLPTPGKAVRGLMIAIFAVWLCFAIGLNWGGASPAVFEILTGNTERILQGELWRLFTAPLVHTAQGGLGVSHIITTLLGLFFLTPRLEEAWGGRRLLRFIATSALLGYLLQILVELVVPVTLARRLVGPMWYGLSPALGAVAIAWALTFKNQVVHLFFVIPVSSRMLIVFVVGMATLYLAAGAVPPEGLVSPYGGMLCGWLLGGGTPSPLRKAWLKLRLAQLGKQAQRQNGRRPRPNPGGLRVIPGGRSSDSDDDGKGPDGRWLN